MKVNMLKSTDDDDDNDDGDDDIPTNAYYQI